MYLLTLACVLLLTGVLRQLLGMQQIMLPCQTLTHPPLLVGARAACLAWERTTCLAPPAFLLPAHQGECLQMHMVCRNSWRHP